MVLSHFPWDFISIFDRYCNLWTDPCGMMVVPPVLRMTFKVPDIESNRNIAMH